MFKSSANVFRIRQTVSDLRALISSASETTLDRIAAGSPGDPHINARGLRRLIETNGARFALPGDRDLFEVALLASAQPDEDFPAFITATAMLLADRLQGGDGSDDLYWNWDSFAEQYALADPAARAALMNGFRTGALTGRVLVEDPPDDAACLTRTRDAVLALGPSSELARLIERRPPAHLAGAEWSRLAGGAMTEADIAAFRYLYERRESLLPKRPGEAPLIPWRAV